MPYCVVAARIGEKDTENKSALISIFFECVLYVLFYAAYNSKYIKCPLRNVEGSKDLFNFSNK